MGIAIKVNVSIVLTVHREGEILLATLKSLDLAAQTARAQGILTELVAVFDSADVDTRRVAERWGWTGFTSVRFFTVDFCSVSESRNFGILSARGEFVWTADADDLVSSNSVSQMFGTISECGSTPVAIFFEYLVTFDAEETFVARYVNSDELTSADYVSSHPFTSRVFSRRTDLMGIPYRHSPLSSGFSYEDWDFNNRCRAAGWLQKVAPSTILFYRQSPKGLYQEALKNTDGFVRNSGLHSRDSCAGAVEKELTARGGLADHLRRREELTIINFRDELLSHAQTTELIEEQSAIEGRIRPSDITNALSISPFPGPYAHWGYALAPLLEILGADAQETFVLLSESDLVRFHSYLAGANVTAGNLSRGLCFLMLEPLSDPISVVDLQRLGCLINLPAFFPDLPAVDLENLLCRALISVAGNHASVVMSETLFESDFFLRFRRVLSSKLKLEELSVWLRNSYALP